VLYNGDKSWRYPTHSLFILGGSTKSNPFDDVLLHEGLHIRLAAKLFEEGVSTLYKADELGQTFWYQLTIFE